MTNEQLIALAEEARANAYAPYSGFFVGAALLGANGVVYTGCNFENASYSATLCAERVAFGKAVSEGCRSFLKIAVVGGKGDEPLAQACPPCGVCRQVMRELCGDDFQIVLSDGQRTVSYTLADLLPAGFSSEHL